METSITSETLSQQTICGDVENLSLEITGYTEPKLAQIKGKTEIKQIKNNLIRARGIYCRYFPSQKMASYKGDGSKECHDGDQNYPPTYPTKIWEKNWC